MRAKPTRPPTFDSDSKPDLDEDTLPELRFDDPEEQGTQAPGRDVRIVDFKDVRTEVSVSHGPADPSRVWLMFENQDSIIHISIEEGIARRLFEWLGGVLARFRDEGVPIAPKDTVR